MRSTSCRRKNKSALARFAAYSKRSVGKAMPSRLQPRQPPTWSPGYPVPLNNGIAMGPKIGDIDIASTLLEHEFRILVLEGVIDVLMSRIPIVGPAVRPEEVQQIRERAIARLKLKYPNANIQLESV